MSGGYSTPKYQLNDAQSIQRLIQSITFNIQKIAQNGWFNSMIFSNLILLKFETIFS
jgi:hypothetical protein